MLSKKHSFVRRLKGSCELKMLSTLTKWQSMRQFIDGEVALYLPLLGYS